MTDTDAVIARVLKGDREAFRGIVAEHQDMLLAFAKYRLGRRDLAEEVVQQTFIRAFARLADFRIGEDFGIWLRVICNYMVMTEVKRLAREQHNHEQYREHIQTGLAGEALAGPPGPEADASVALDACLRGLSETAQALLTGKYAEGRSLQDLADAHGHSLAWVATTLHRLRLSVRQCIERRLETEAGEP